MPKKICKQCHKPFVTKSDHKVFCCKECRIAYYNEHFASVIQICPICGKEFKTYKSRPKVCCSKHCSSKHLWQNSEYAMKILTSLQNIRNDLKIEEKRIRNCKITMQNSTYKEKLKWHHKYNPNMGMTGKAHTLETKEKISKAHIGKKCIFSEEHRKKLSLVNCGKKRSQAVRDKLSEIARNRTPEELEKRKQKEYNTKKERGSFSGKATLIFNGIIYKCSENEKIIYDTLLTKFTVIPQYRSDLYPFTCDFYIPELDLYIEYQGFWSHGKHPFDPYSENDNRILQIWKQKTNHLMYKNAISVWTVRDPLKRKIAKENNLNWLEFFNMNEFENWYKTLEI